MIFRTLSLSTCSLKARHDWQKKLKDRRKEVRDLKKRQNKEREKEARKRKKQQEREKAEKEMQAKLQMEREAYDMQIQALAPKIEAMEASWNRLRTISGADTPADVIGYWEGLYFPYSLKLRCAVWFG